MLRGVTSATALAILGAARWSWGTTYYVSPTGSDSNNGTSPGSAWQSVTKVDDTNFSAGDQILFQDGGNWYGSLNATSSGTTSQPIVYGSYGSGTDPTFWGSNVVSAASFQTVSGTTYSYASSTAVTSFFVNDQFTHSAALVSGQSTDAGNISYVESNPNTWYYDATNSHLYVNTGSTIASGNGKTYSAAVRSNAVDSNAQSNVVFENLETNETAAANGGYGVYIWSGSNVTVQNCVVLNGGKHNVAVINANATVSGTLASGVMPDQGAGGATAFVSYSDDEHTGDVSVYNNDTVTNYPNLPAFYDHADTNQSLTSVTLNNFTSYGSPIQLQMGTGDHAQINGGLLVNASLNLNGNSTVNGMTITGANGFINLSASNNVVQNTLITGVAPTNPYLSAIIDQGTNDVVRDSTIDVSPTAKSSVAIELTDANSNFEAYGNVLVGPDRMLQTYYQFNASPQFSAPDDFKLAYNLYDGNPTDEFADITNLNPITLAQMQSLGLDTGSINGVPQFVDAADGNYALLPTSAGYQLVPLNSLTEGDIEDILDQPRPQSGFDNPGAYTVVNLAWNNSGGGNGTSWDTTNTNWTNAAGPDGYTDGANVTFNDNNNGHYAVTLNTLVSPASVTFNSTGNYTLSGSGGIRGADRSRNRGRER